MLAECSCIGTIVNLSQLSEQTEDGWSDGGAIKRKEDTREEFFFTLCGHGVKNWVHFGHNWNENVYLCTYAKRFCFSLLPRPVPVCGLLRLLLAMLEWEEENV